MNKCFDFWIELELIIISSYRLLHAVEQNFLQKKNSWFLKSNLETFPKKESTPETKNIKMVLKMILLPPSDEEKNLRKKFFFLLKISLERNTMEQKKYGNTAQSIEYINAWL